MITVLAGDFKKDGVAVFKKAMLGLGKPTHIVMPMPGMFKTDAIALDDVVGAEVVTSGSASLANAALGALVAGAAGAIVGMLAGGQKVLGVTFKDGRKALLKCGQAEAEVLLAATFGKSEPATV